jgi:hypothetical protein
LYVKPHNNQSGYPLHRSDWYGGVWK